MDLAKSIDELYDEVKDFDLVICNDAPLALALNNRLDRPIVGTFATTPRRIAQSMALDILGRSTLSDIEVVRRVSEETGYKLRFVHGEIDNIKTMVRYKEDITPLLKKRSKRIYESYRDMPTLDRVMSEFDITKSDYYKGKRIAIIGVELFDQLDKRMIPQDFEDISLFKRGSYIIPEIRELNNNRQIAENAVSIIPHDRATDFAIVMDVGGSIADAVRSALYRRKIPFKNTLNVRDLNHVREFLEFVSLSLTFDTVRISQIRELISSYGGRIQSKYDEYLAEKFIETQENLSERTSEILEVMRNISSMTYYEVCRKVIDGKRAAQVIVLLDEMGLKDSKVSASDTEDLVYAVNNITDLKHNEQIPDSEKEGVVLIDCKNSVFIDRPVVIYVGMGQEWDKDLSFLNQIDYRMKPDENDRDLEKFQILMQQGVRRICICNAIKNGKKPKPCSLFEQCTKDNVKGFADVCEKLIHGPWTVSDTPKELKVGTELFDKEPYSNPFSKTSYSNFVSCPRMFMFGKLTSSPERSSNVVGNILHEYAEMRMCYPDIVKEIGIEHYIDEISEQCSGLFPPEIRAVETSKIRNSILNLDRYIESEGLDVHPEPSVKLDREKPNRFFVESGKDLACDFCEKRVYSSDKRMEGIFDVLRGPEIIDFKTGRPKTIKEVRAEIDYKNDKDYKDFQSLFYLSIAEEMHPGENVTFDLFFTSDNMEKGFEDVVFPIEDNVRRVTLIKDAKTFYHDVFAYSLTEKKYVPIQNCVHTLIDDMIEHDLNDPSYLDVLASLVQSCASTNNSTAKGIAKGLISKMNKLNDGGFISENTLYVTLEQLAVFRSRVKEDYERMKSMSNSVFPAVPMIKCEKCGFRDMCMNEDLRGGEADV